MHYDLYNTLKKDHFFIIGPCVIEDYETTRIVAKKAKSIANELNCNIVFKASFDKANRTSLSSYRGLGIKEGLDILAQIKEEFQLPITTDIHEPNQAELVQETIDIIQIPAFLCRQTDLLVAAAKTDKIVNIKKAQFLSGADMKYPVDKVQKSGNEKIFLTERGNMLGYNNLVVDFRNIPDMKSIGVPVIMDCTHSVQRPGGLGGATGGNREFVPYMAKAAKAFGADGFFFETHPNPDKALSDGPNMVELSKIDALIKSLID